MNALSMISIKIIHTKGVMMSPDIKQKKCKNNGTSWVIWSLFLGLPSAMGGFYLALIIAITLCVWKCSLNWKCSRMKACECHSSRRLHCFPGRNIFYALIKSLCSQSTLKSILHILICMSFVVLLNEKHHLVTPQSTFPCYDIKLIALSSRDHCVM